MDEMKEKTEREKKRESAKWGERVREIERKIKLDKRDTLHCVFRKHIFRLSHTYSHCRRYGELFMKYSIFCEEIHLGFCE